MPRPIHATVSLSAMTHNLGVVRRHLDQHARTAGVPAPSVWAVIKANAYGHGIERAVAAFQAAQGLAMLDLDEAVRCREAGWVGPILLLEGFFQPGDIEIVDRYHLTTVLHDIAQIDMLQHARPARRLDAYVKLNTGMNRLGFAPAAYAQAHARACQLHEQGVLGTIGRMTHFAHADGPPGVAAQMACFAEAAGHLPGPASLCNSAALLRYPEAACLPGDEPAWVRPGICLYGASPFEDEPASARGLLPAMTLASELIAVQHLRAGDTVGYGGSFRAPAPMRVGVVACGYADGYPRHAGTGTPVYVAGAATRLLGRVSMDMLAVDLGPAPSARVGSPVVLWGDGGPPVDEVARAAGTIGYELLCALARRVPVRLAQG